MTRTPTPNWQPLSRLPLFTTMIDEAVVEAQAMLGNVQTGVQTPHVLDDHTVDRILNLYTETLEFIALYQAQLKCWQGEATDPETQAEIERLLACLPELETTARAIIKGAQQIRTGTIDRIMEMDDAALGLAGLSGQGFPGR